MQTEPSRGATRLANRDASTGLPDRLKANVDALSGLSLDDVRMHRISPQPAKLQAHAYARRTEINLGLGHKRHLSQEAWHVVHQKEQMRPGAQFDAPMAVDRDAYPLDTTAKTAKPNSPAKFPCANLTKNMPAIQMMKRSPIDIYHHGLVRVEHDRKANTIDMHIEPGKNLSEQHMYEAASRAHGLMSNETKLTLHPQGAAATKKTVGLLSTIFGTEHEKKAAAALAAERKTGDQSKEEFLDGTLHHTVVPEHMHHLRSIRGQQGLSVIPRWPAGQRPEGVNAENYQDDMMLENEAGDAQLSRYFSMLSGPPMSGDVNPTSTGENERKSEKEEEKDVEKGSASRAEGEEGSSSGPQRRPSPSLDISMSKRKLEEGLTRMGGLHFRATNALRKFQGMFAK